MLQMFAGAVTLFFQGRLFADQQEAYKRIGYAIATAGVMGCLLVLLGLPLWVATVGGGLISGAMTPLVCINLRMR